jgi:hypothetical protein
MMGLIYKSATRVLICVGSAGSEFTPGLSGLAGSINRMIDETLYRTFHAGRNDCVTEYWPEHYSDKTSERASHSNNGASGSDFDYRSAVERCLDVTGVHIRCFLSSDDLFPVFLTPQQVILTFQ